MKDEEIISKMLMAQANALQGNCQYGVLIPENRIYTFNLAGEKITSTKIEYRQEPISDFINRYSKVDIKLADIDINMLPIIVVEVA